jgi:hypothetical protein
MPAGLQKAIAIGFYRQPKSLFLALRREAGRWQQVVLEVFELA